MTDHAPPWTIKLAELIDRPEAMCRRILTFSPSTARRSAQMAQGRDQVPQRGNREIGIFFNEAVVTRLIGTQVSGKVTNRLQAVLCRPSGTGEAVAALGAPMPSVRAPVETIGIAR